MLAAYADAGSSFAMCLYYFSFSSRSKIYAKYSFFSSFGSLDAATTSGAVSLGPVIEKFIYFLILQISSSSMSTW